MRHNISLHQPINNRSRATHGASPDNRLHSADSLACSHTGPLRASPDNRLSTGRLTRPQPRRIFTLLRTTGSPRADSPANSLAGSSSFSGQQAANGRTQSPTASPDLCATPDNQLPRMHGLQLHRCTLRIFTDRLPRHANASSRPPTTHCS
jgi:hypothetical protein